MSVIETEEIRDREKTDGLLNEFASVLRVLLPSNIQQAFFNTLGSNFKSARVPESRIAFSAQSATSRSGIVIGRLEWCR